MKIYICHTNLLGEIDKHFNDLTNEEVIAMCNADEEMDYHDEYDNIEELSAYWNSDEILYPSDSYMRVIND